MIETYHSEYSLPEGLTEAQVRSGIIELVRPCSPQITAYLVKLQAVKPIYNADKVKIEAIYECLYEALKEFPEVAVILALEDMKLTEEKWFPTTGDIIREVSKYHDSIIDITDYLGNST